MATKLSGRDFMMMDVHRPLTGEEIDEVHPQACVDRSIEPGPDVAAQTTASVGAAPGQVPAAGAQQAELRLLDPLPHNVELLDVPTSHRLQVQRVLQSALDQGLDDVMVVGWLDDGPIFFLATDPSIGNAVYRLELAKQRLLAAVSDRWQTDIPTTRDYMPDDPA